MILLVFIDSGLVTLQDINLIVEYPELFLEALDDHEYFDEIDRMHKCCPYQMYVETINKK